MQVFAVVFVGADDESLCGSPIGSITLVLTVGNTYLYYTASPLLFGEIPMEFTSSRELSPRLDLSFVFSFSDMFFGHSSFLEYSEIRNFDWAKKITRFFSGN